MVTVDVDLNEKTLNWAINAQYLSVEDVATSTSQEIAFAASI